MQVVDSVLGSCMKAGLTWLSRRRLPQVRGVCHLPGLETSVEVTRDRWGVPHLYACNYHDLMMAQGFVHAQDRLWQMDFQRRLVAGRLAEILGPMATSVDRWIRTIGMRRVAEREVSLLAGDVRAGLEAYAAGVNACIARQRLPVEFVLLRYEPEPWTVADTLSWIKMMSWSLSVNWETEVLRAQLVERLGPEAAAELEPPYFDNWPRILAAGQSRPQLGDEAQMRADESRPFAGPPPVAGLGSNSWVVAGWRTASGRPLLANDMHLLMSMPGIWYENHLNDGGCSITGVTFPGIPGVVAGHNDYVAWGFTNGFADVQDLYMEHLRRIDDGRVLYEFRGEWLEAEVVHEEIRVKGQASVFEEVVITRHGPIINGFTDELKTSSPLALRWTSLEPDTMYHAMRGLNCARSCAEVREALREWTGPVQNVVYTDIDGNIGYTLAGKVPVRAQGDGQQPVPGWTGEYEWTSYIPFEEMPRIDNPPKGYIVTANNRVADDDYPYYLGREHCTGNRAQRITELIEACPPGEMDTAYAQKMQYDRISPAGRTVARCLAEIETDDPELAPVIELMAGWDGEIAPDSPAAGVYEVFVRRYLANLLTERLGNLTLRYMGKGPVPVLAESSLFGERSIEWLERTLADPQRTWFTNRGLDREREILAALRQAVDYLRDRFGADISTWHWGKIHTLTFTHILGRVEPLGQFFNRGPYPIGGDSTTVWQAASNYHDLKSPGVISPPFRMVIDMDDPAHAQGILAPGQSGQPGSPHYDDQIQAWFTGRYHPMLTLSTDVEREARSVLHLMPAQGDTDATP